MLYITGDIHCPVDVHKLNATNWPEQKGLSRDDYLIVCGDMGFVWGRITEDDYWQRWFEDKPFTTLFVDGNHENHFLLSKYPVEEWHGGKVHKIRPHVIHLMRGQIYEISDTRFFTMGGASSIDKELRIEGVSWWREELPSYAELAEGLDNLEKCEWNVDYVITHACSTRILLQLFRYPMLDGLNAYLDEIDNHLTYKHWFFGHYHLDRRVGDKHTCLYNRIIKIS